MEADRIKRLEKMNERLSRRTKKTAKAMITPFPLSGAIIGEDVHGTVILNMFPCDGVITKGVVRLGEKPKQPLTLTVALKNDSGAISKDFTLEKRLIHVRPDLQVKAGDCLGITLMHNPESPVSEIWVALLWTPTVKDVEAKSFLIETLEAT